jgi:DNA-binding transcriptional MerR regulator
LPPAAVDPDTGYRLYATGQISVGEAIRLLRRVEVPLDDVATLLATSDPATVRSLLLDHQRRTALRSAQLRVVLQRLQPLLDGKDEIMGTRAQALDQETHRRLGIDCFNKTWTLMEKDDGTQAEDDEMLHCAHARAEDDEMLHCAHASAYHWLQAGTAANHARGE